MKISPAGSQVTSVGWPKRPWFGRQRRLDVRPGLGLGVGSFLLASDHHGHAPSGLNLMIMSEPLSIAQILSSLSTRTAWANDHA